MAGIKMGSLIRTIAINSEDYLFFDELMVILISNTSFVMAREIVNGVRNQHHTQSQFPFAAINKKEVYSYSYYQLLTKIYDREPINEIEIRVTEKVITNIENIPGSTFLNHAQTFNFIRKVISSSYISFYEKVIGLIEAKYGKDSLPDDLNFARVVRNAFAHDGKIYIKNRNTPAVSWEGIVYSRENNGKSIFDDFFVVEIIDLMCTINEYLK